MLIKSVAQAIPVYLMACFRLPRGLCENITSIIRQFWWGSKQGKWKPAWVSWDVLTHPKHLKGLGFRDMEIFNLALLARQSWRILQDPSSLSTRLLKVVYYPQSSILEAELGNHPSQIWRAIIDGRDILKQGLIRRIGNGATTDSWETNWIPRTGPMRPITSLVANPPTRVAELIDVTTPTWGEQLIRFVFMSFDADAILAIPLCTRNIEDFWAWSGERGGTFSVKSAYHMVLNTKYQRENWIEEKAGISELAPEGKAWMSLWHTKVPSKQKVFAWRLAQHSVPTADILHHRHMSQSPLYALCGTPDSWRHAMLDCTMSRCIWA